MTRAGDLERLAADVDGDFDREIMGFREVEAAATGTRRFQSKPLNVTTTFMSTTTAPAYVMLLREATTKR